ncbi:MAG: peptidase dimerization domain-containing protein [Xanthomonadaceae bacterium]|nr:peptidase dimerization domain-containing protein [Xanthomonadaceae bacterium]
MNPTKALLGAPTEMKELKSNKSLTSFKVQFLFQGSEKDARGFNRKVELQSRGKSVSSATPKPEQNALHNLLGLISKATEAGFELKFRSLNAGSYSHQCPDFAKAEIYLTSHQFEDFKRFFKEYSSRYRLGEDWFNIDFGGLGDLGISFLPDDIYKSFNEIIDLMRVMGVELESNWDETFAVPSPTLAVNTITTDLSQLTVRFDLRLLPKQDRSTIAKETIQRLKQVAMNYPTINVRVSEDYHTPAFESSQGGELNTSMSTGAGFLVEKGIETSVIGPGNGEGNVGSSDEFLELMDLDRAIQYYEKYIERECL